MNRDMATNYTHILWAKEMKNKYTKLLESFSILEVVEIWEAYSDTYAAGWLSETKERVEEVFQRLLK